MVRQIVLAVLGKISNLLIQELHSLPVFEHQIQSIETLLRRRADDSENVLDKDHLRELLYDLEDAIDDLIIKSSQRRNRNALIQYVLGFLNLQNHFFYISVLAVIDLVDHYRLRLRFEQIEIDIRSACSVTYKAGFWWDSFDPYQLDIGYAVISPVISLFETLATQNQLRLAVRRQARWLRDEFKSLLDFVRNVDSQELSEEGMLWLEEVFDVCRSAENVVGFFMNLQQKKMKNGNVGSFDNLLWAPRNFISQHKLARKMAWIKDKIFDISNRRFRAVLSRQMSWIDNLRRSFQQNEVLPHEVVPYGFEEDIDAVTAQLLKDDSRCITISIVGAKGTGKTNLVKLIYDSQAILDHFPHCIWVSEGGDKVDILKQILGLDDDSDLYFKRNDTTESYYARLRQMLSAFIVDNKYLIVVDDAYPIRFWKEMGIVFEERSNGTRIIFIVGNLREAPPVTETNFTYRLHLRTDNESWALFTHSLKVNIPPEMQNLRGDITRKCGGLPKVIVKLAERLSQRDATVEEWSTVLDQLNEDKEPWSKILLEINRYLPLYLRRCLFYFGLFPAGQQIPARRLIALSVAEGLGRQQSDSKSPEFVADECLRELINYNMVQVTQKKLNGKVNKCCLPEALQVHWFLKAKETNFLHGHSDISSLGTCLVRRLADHLNQNDPIFDHIHGNSTTYPIYPLYKNVVSFLSFDTREGSRAGEDIGNYLDRCISSNCFLFLWVLDLENVYKPKLPQALGQLIQLRYVGLRSTYLEILPMFINKLLNLQTLDLKRTCINNLPHSIWKMQKLRHLFLDESSHSMFVPRQDGSSLANLQTLWGVFIDEDSPVKNGLDTLLSITKLGLKCKVSVPSQKRAMPSQLQAVANWVMNLKCLKSLRFKSFDESGQPWDIYLESLLGHEDLSSVYLVGKLKNQNIVSNFPQNLIELALAASGLVEDPMQTLDKLSNLRILRLLSGSFNGKKMLCSFNGFPKLEVLKFWELEQLEEWNVEEGAMTCLKDMEIRRCINLKMLPDGLRSINTLREVKLTNLPMLSSSLKDMQGDDWNKIAHVRHVCIQD